MRYIATALFLLAAPLLSQGQSIGGLTARAMANSIALRPSSLEGATLQDLKFSYSQDAGATWQPIDAACLEYISGEAIWHVLECLQTDAFEGAALQFKASVSSCKPVTFDGYTYKVVEIGSQCWFAENLRTEHYANGDVIPSSLSNSLWENTSAGALAVYEDDRANLATYGRLYNLYAVDDLRGVCPSGWHVPSDGEFMTLEMELSMSSSQANSAFWRGTDEGTQLKASASDSPGWNGTNSSGFSALPGGHRDYDGHFLYVDSFAFFWSSSPSGSNAWSRVLSSGDDDVYRSNYSQRYGFSVRCVRD